MTPKDGLGAVREALDRHGLTARKSFGQHFLLDLNVTRKVARAAADLAGRLVLEIGPGPGGLTRALLETDAARIIAVEKDERFLPLLQEIAGADDRLIVVAADALAIDETTLTSQHGAGLPIKVVANLPYNVGTPLLVHWLTGPFRPESLTLMFQKEVARRIVAHPGDADYGRLAVLAGALSQARIAFELPARAFTPPPKVDSAVVALTPIADRPDDATIAALQRVTAAAFGQRRKMLRSSLKSLGGERLLESVGLNPTARAEEIEVSGFLRLARSLQSGSAISL